MKMYTDDRTGTRYHIERKNIHGHMVDVKVYEPATYEPEWITVLEKLVADIDPSQIRTYEEETGQIRNTEDEKE